MTTTEPATETRKLKLGLTAVIYLKPPACTFCAVRGPQLSEVRLSDGSTIEDICDGCATEVQRFSDLAFPSAHPAKNARTA